MPASVITIPAGVTAIPTDGALKSHSCHAQRKSGAATLVRFITSYTFSGFSRSAFRIFYRSFSTTRLLPIKRAIRLRIGKLIFRNCSPDILRLTLFDI
jgi:hypothetical protein